MCHRYGIQEETVDRVLSVSVLMVIVSGLSVNVPGQAFQQGCSSGRHSIRQLQELGVWKYVLGVRNTPSRPSSVGQRLIL